MNVVGQRRKGIEIAVCAAVVSGFAVFVNGLAVQRFDDPRVYTTAKNLIAGTVLLIALVATTTVASVPRVSSVSRSAWPTLAVIAVLIERGLPPRPKGDRIQPITITAAQGEFAAMAIEDRAALRVDDERVGPLSGSSRAPGVRVRRLQHDDAADDEHENKRQQDQRRDQPIPRVACFRVPNSIVWARRINALARIFPQILARRTSSGAPLLSAGRSR